MTLDSATIMSNHRGGNFRHRHQQQDAAEYDNVNNNDNDNDDDEDLALLEPLPQRVLDFTTAGTTSPKRISHVQFGLLSAADMERLAECPIHRRDLYTLSSVAGPPRAPAAVPSSALTRRPTCVSALPVTFARLPLKNIYL